MIRELVQVYQALYVITTCNSQFGSTNFVTGNMLLGLLAIRHVTTGLGIDSTRVGHSLHMWAIPSTLWASTSHIWRLFFPWHGLALFTCVGSLESESSRRGYPQKGNIIKCHHTSYLRQIWDMFTSFLDKKDNRGVPRYKGLGLTPEKSLKILKIFADSSNYYKYFTFAHKPPISISQVRPCTYGCPPAGDVGK